MLDAGKNKGRLLPYVRNPDVRWFDVDVSNLRLMPFEDREYERYGLEPGDVLVCEGGDAARAAIWRGQRKDVKFQKAIHRVRVGPRLDNRFLVHRLLADHQSGRLADYYTGATIKHLTGQDLARYSFALPPLAEQHRIADILDRADEMRAKRREAVALLDEMAAALFVEPFGDPASNLKGWPVEPFGAVSDARLGKMLDHKRQTGAPRRPYLRNANVQWFRFELDSVFEMDFDESDRNVLRLQVGDLLICEGGEPGRAAIWQGELTECYFQKALHRVRPNPALTTPEYLCWLLWLMTRRGNLAGVTSATIAHLTGEKLAKLPVMLPPLVLQHWFVAAIAAIDRLKAAHRASLAEMDALFASLQHRAFRGEL